MALNFNNYVSLVAISNHLWSASYCLLIYFYGPNNSTVVSEQNKIQAW